MSSKTTNGSQLKKLLPRGSQGEIARILNLRKSTVSMALDQMNPNHPAVAEAVRIIEKAGTAETFRKLQSLLATVDTAATALTTTAQ